MTPSPELVLAVLQSDPNVAWTNACVWRKLQDSYSEGIAQDVSSGETQHEDWPYREDRIAEMMMEITGQIAGINVVLQGLWNNGKVLRRRTFGGQGEWCLPELGGLTPKQWRAQRRRAG